jgi:hypothetical protein
MPGASTILRATAATLTLSALFSSTAAAQELLLKAGLASSTLSADSRAGEGAGRRPAVIAGASIFLLSADRGGWQLEALFIQKGARHALRVDDEVRLTYLEIPVLLHADVWQQDDRAAFFSVGPAVAFRLNGTYVDAGVSEDIGDDIARVDAGLHFGGGVELGPLVVEARYILDLRTAFVADDRSFANRAFVLTAGVRFRR